MQQRRLPDSRIQITYGVRNVSTQNYVSGSNQQAILLTRNGRTATNRPFGNLAAGQTLTWSQTVARPFEFPDTYAALYNYDPDLYIDGNPQNDDCNRNNNMRRVEVR